MLFRVVDALVDHFLSFKKEQRQLPVVWHQSLLCFVQRWQLLALAWTSHYLNTPLALGSELLVFCRCRSEILAGGLQQKEVATKIIHWQIQAYPCFLLQTMVTFSTDACMLNFQICGCHADTRTRSGQMIRWHCRS